MPAELKQLNITLQSEQFSSRHVTVVLDWMQATESIVYSYNIHVVPEVEVMFSGSTMAQLTLSYNTRYNVSVVATHLCRLASVFSSIELYYRKLSKYLCKMRLLSVYITY